MKENKKEILKIFERESSIADTAREYCRRYNIEYTDSIRRRFSTYINSWIDRDLDNETSTETNQYENDKEKEEELFMPSAWSVEKERFLSIDEYCDKYGLPKEQVRSSKLVAHQSKHMIYNIAFNETISDKTGIDEEFIEEIVKKHIVKTDVTRATAPLNSSWVDRLIITDVHIGMSTEGGVNTVPLYDTPWNKEIVMERLDILVDYVTEFKKGDVLYIDELGDFCDGLGAQTTRKGHSLPQNMSDKESFELGVEFKVRLVEKLLPFYSKIICNSVTSDNHSFLLGYFVNSTAKKILEAKYDNVEYNVLERFINHYSVGNHTFVISHGKDEEALKFGFKPFLDAKQAEKIDQYCKEHELYNGNKIEFSKGDSHQCIFDYTTSSDFDYMNYPSFSPPSNWVKINYKLSKSGFVLQNLSLDGDHKTVNIKWF